MKAVKIVAVIIFLLSLLVLSGCSEELKDCRIQNDVQARQIDQLKSEVQAYLLQVDQLNRQLENTQGLSSTEIDTLNKKLAALEEDLAKKKSLISSMQNQLLYGGAQIPVEISTMLEDFAKDEDMVTFDSVRGIVKFKSDLLFEKGSDVVAPSAISAIQKLCKILTTEKSEQFDIIIAGHTDDMPIGKPSTRQKHPTNWHLSAHRAISVLGVMSNNGVESKRVSVRGFGEYRPAEDNKPGKKGNPQNRRVEIYLVPQGM